MEGDKMKKYPSIGEVSFSSYLTTAEEIFVHKLADPSMASNIGIRTPARLGRDKVVEEGETSVFGAERYFNMKLEDDQRLDVDECSDKHSVKTESRHDVHQMTPRRWPPGTPSASSETSWNSQTVLLRSLVRNRSENRPRKVDGRSFFSNLSCTGACTDGKSVYVNQNVDRHGKESMKEHKQLHQRPVHVDRRKRYEAKLQSFDQMNVGSNREVYYCRPPVLKPGLQNVTVKTQTDDDPRKSLEVFGSTAVKKGDIAKNLERKLSMLTWDAIPNTSSISSKSQSGQIGDDVKSDASSDLFEIDNISASGDQVLFTRQASDGMSSCMTPYAPSETSIEWSVVTASAADCSFVSDYDEKKTGKLINSRSGGILGCKSQKAVTVAESAYRSYDKPKSTQLHQLPKPVTTATMPKVFDFP